jgi:hypothetical protein
MFFTILDEPFDTHLSSLRTQHFLHFFALF